MQNLPPTTDAAGAPRPGIPFERVPLLAWALLTVAAVALRVEYAVGSFSFATAFALLAGSSVGPRRGAMSQAAALALSIPLILTTTWAGGPIDLVYAVGRIPAAALAGHFAPLGSELRRPTRAILAGVAAVAAAAAGAVALAPTSTGSPLTRNTLSVVALAVTITVYYGYRLISEPMRIAAYVASLAPYYAIGLIGTALLVLGGAVAPDVAGIAGDLGGLLFRGALNHLPGDLLGIVLIAYLSSARRRSGRLLLR